MNTLPKMRTVAEIAAIVKQADSDTHITESTIRRFIRDGTLPCVRAGKKVLISLEVFYRFLNGETVAEPIPVSQTPIIPIEKFRQKGENEDVL